MEQELTPIFPPRMKPARVGIYMATTNLSERYYRMWNGHSWLTGGPTVKAAAREARHGIENTSPMFWRGLAHPPKEQQ